MTVNSKPRLGGWLMVPLAWLIVTLLASALVITLLVLRPVPMSAPQPVLLQWGASLATSVLMLVYTAWITWIFCQRSQRLPRHYTLWLLLNVVLAVKTFVYSPVSDNLALRTLLFALLAASILVPYFKRSQRVKTTFIAP